MKSPALKTVGKLEKTPILIVDKIGVIGEALAQEFSKDFLVFFVSKRFQSRKNENIVRIPFKGKIPKVPENLYSKTFIIDDGENITRESVLSFIKNAKQTDTAFYFLGSIRNIDLKQADEIIKKYSKVKVLIFGDIFDNEILFDKDASITKFIIETRRNKKIKVPGVGLSLNYPISLNDTIKLILKAAYIEIPEKAVLLFSKHPITDISLANTFQKIDPDIDVDFEKEENKREVYFPKNSQYALGSYDLKKKLSEIDLESEEKSEEFIKNSKNIKFVKPVIFFMIASIFLMMLPLIATFGYSQIAEMQIKKAVDLAQNGEIENALSKSKNAERFYDFAGQTADALVFQSEFVGKEKTASEILKKIDSGKELSNASIYLLEGVTFLEKAIREGNASELTNTTDSFKSAYLILQKLYAAKTIPKDLEEEYRNLFPVIEFVSDSSEILPGILGFDKEKKYLVLFTNNSELRSGGGVVDGVGIASIKDGKITKFEIVDSSKIDEKLTSNIEPPFALKRYLNKDSFTIEDSLFESNFPEGAAAAASIYKTIENTDVDGVIAIGPGFFEKLLLNLESIRIENSNAEVNSKNLNELISQKNVLLTEIVSTVVEKKEIKRKLSYLKTAEIIGESASDKELLFAFKDGEIQRMFSAKKLSGEISDQRLNNEKALNDYFGISESNLGNNTASYYVSRSVLREVEINEEGQLTSVIKISFRNNSEGDGGVDYKNYLRLILPEGSRIQSVSDGGKNTGVLPAITDPGIYERSGFVPPKEIEIEEKNENGKSIFGFLISVAPGSVKNINVEYTLPFRLTEEGMKYSLIVNKQPGLKKYSFDQIFNLPESYKVVPENKFSSEIDQDKEFIYYISQN